MFASDGRILEKGCGKADGKVSLLSGFGHCPQLILSSSNFNRRCFERMK